LIVYCCLNPPTTSPTRAALAAPRWSGTARHRFPCSGIDRNLSLFSRSPFHPHIEQLVFPLLCSDSGVFPQRIKVRHYFFFARLDSSSSVFFLDFPSGWPSPSVLRRRSDSFFRHVCWTNAQSPDGLRFFPVPSRRSLLSLSLAPVVRANVLG